MGEISNPVQNRRHIFSSIFEEVDTGPLKIKVRKYIQYSGAIEPKNFSQNCQNGLYSPGVGSIAPEWAL